MTNTPGKRDAKFRGRSRLSAAELTRLTQMALKRIVPGRGISLRTINNQVIISTKEQGFAGAAKKDEGGGVIDCNVYYFFEIIVTNFNPGDPEYGRWAMRSDGSQRSARDLMDGASVPWVGIGNASGKISGSLRAPSQPNSVELVTPVGTMFTPAFPNNGNGYSLGTLLGSDSVSYDFALVSGATEHEGEPIPAPLGITTISGDCYDYSGTNRDVLPAGW